MIETWQRNGALLTVHVYPFYADVVSAVDEEDGEPVPLILFAPQREMNAIAEEAWANEQGM